jgi:WD40 repeat protein
MGPLFRGAGRLALVVLLFAPACFDRGPPVWAPNPSASGPPGEACARARRFRDRAPALLDEGRLDRAVRVLQRAEELCPAEAPATWAPRVRALAALGRSAEALQLAARIDRSDRANDADRAAAAAARAVAEEHGRAVTERGSRRDAPELFDPAEKRRKAADALFHEGVEASRAGDHVGAGKRFRDAWETWRPNPRALVEAGLEALAAGHRAEAQALWDRAAYDDATVAIHPEMISGAPPLYAGAALAWSPDGARLAVGGDDSLTLFDAELRPTLRVPTGEAVVALAFAAGAGRLFAGLANGAVRVVDAVTGALEDGLPGEGVAVRALAVSPDRRTLAASGDDGRVRLGEPGGPLRVLRAPRGASGSVIAFDDTGARLAAAGDDGRIALWDTSSGALAATLPAHGGAVRAMAFEGASLDVVTAAERVRWDVTRPRRPRPVTLGRARAERASIAVAAGEAGAVVAAVAGAELGVGDLADGVSLASTASADHGGLVALALAPGGRALAVVYRDRTVAVLPAAERREPRVLAPSGRVDALAPSPDGRTIAAAVDGRVLVWRAGGDRLRAYEPGAARALAFSPDGTALAMGVADARIVIRDLAERRPDRILEAGGAVESLAFSADGARLVAGTAAPSVQILAAAAAGDARALRLEAGPVRAARFSPDGASVLIASKEGLTLWSPTAREGLRFVPYGPEARDAAFTPDGAGMAVADQRGQLLLGKPAASAPAPAQTVLVPTQVLALAIAADGTIATAEGDRALTLRSPAGKPVQRFHDPDAAMRAVAFLSGHVAAGLGDGSVRLYRAPAAGPVAILRAAPGLAAGKVGGVVSGPGGHLEIVGPDAVAARGAIRCRLGAALYPLEVCAEQFLVEGLLPMVLAGQDPAEAEP